MATYTCDGQIKRPLRHTTSTPKNLPTTMNPLRPMTGLESKNSSTLLSSQPQNRARHNYSRADNYPLLNKEEETTTLVWLPARNSTHNKEKPPCHQIINAGTRFNAAIFLTGESTMTVRNGFIKAWSSMHIGMPQSMLAD